VSLKAKGFAQDRLQICLHGERKVIAGDKIRQRAPRKVQASASIAGLIGPEPWVAGVRFTAKTGQLRRMLFETKNSPCGQKPWPHLL
jgi:hypothetical protein